MSIQKRSLRKQSRKQSSPRQGLQTAQSTIPGTVAGIHACRVSQHSQDAPPFGEITTRQCPSDEPTAGLHNTQSSSNMQGVGISNVDWRV